jgi:hypothetical protein
MKLKFYKLFTTILPRELSRCFATDYQNSTKRIKRKFLQIIFKIQPRESSKHSSSLSQDFFQEYKTEVFPVNGQEFFQENQTDVLTVNH